MLWLSFWYATAIGDHHELQPMVGRLALASVASGLRLTINLASSNVQPASEKDKAVLYRPEDAQHFDDEPQIQAEQH